MVYDHRPNFCPSSFHCYPNDASPDCVICHVDVHVLANGILIGMNHMNVNANEMTSNVIAIDDENANDYEIENEKMTSV